MTTAVYSHNACEKHDTGIGHPERPERLRAIEKALESEEFHYLARRDAPIASEEVLARVHPERFIRRVLDVPQDDEIRYLDGDTVVCKTSPEAALRAAGAVVAAVDSVLDGGFHNAFCAVRPPGHHAEAERAMGFCLFGNVMVGAKHALDHYNLERVAVVDFDVHHGNGTESISRKDKRVLFVSTHEDGNYPGTGHADDQGEFGNLINLPLPSGTGSTGFRNAITTSVLPALAKFRPEMILVSAGFDAHHLDPLGGLGLKESDFGWVTAELCRAADDLCLGRLVSTLEGGYDLDALALSTSAHVRALMKG